MHSHICPVIMIMLLGHRRSYLMPYFCKQERGLSLMLVTISASLFTGRECGLINPIRELRLNYFLGPFLFSDRTGSCSACFCMLRVAPFLEPHCYCALQLWPHQSPALSVRFGKCISHMGPKSQRAGTTGSGKLDAEFICIYWGVEHIYIYKWCKCSAFVYSWQKKNR